MFEVKNIVNFPPSKIANLNNYQIALWQRLETQTL